MMKLLSLLLCLGILIGVFAACSSTMPQASVETPKSETKKTEPEEPQGLAYTLLQNGTYEVSVGTEIDAVKIEIPASYQGIRVTSIADSAFYGCQKLRSIVISNGIEQIGNGAFEECVSLSSVKIPASVTKIGTGVFGYCTGLTTMEIDPKNTVYEMIGDGLYHKETKELVQYTPGATLFELSEQVRSIGNGAFLGCVAMTELTIPQSTVKLGDEAFRDCDGLTRIHLPNGILRIGAECFAGCDALESITMSEGLQSIGAAAFRDCEMLTEISLPNGVTTLSANAFDGCVLLETIRLPSTLQKIGYDAFYGTKYYDTESNWENGVLYLDGYLIQATSSVAPSYSVQADTKLIADGAFSHCNGLTEVILCESIESIGDSAFYWCMDLTTVTVYSGIERIGAGAFAYCNALEEICFVGSEDAWLSVEKAEAKIPASVTIVYSFSA